MADPIETLTMTVEVAKQVVKKNVEVSKDIEQKKQDEIIKRKGEQNR